MNPPWTRKLEARGVTSSSGVILVVGLVIAGYGLVAFNRAHVDRHATGGFGSGMSPGGREMLSIVVILVGLGMIFAAAVGY